MLESRSQKYSKNSRWIWRKKNHEVEQIQSKLQEMSMTTTRSQYIPNDVMIQILSRLPGKSLLRFRWACKNWFDLITNPSFTKLQLRNHAINNPLLMIISGTTKTGSLILRSLNCTKLVKDDDRSDKGSSSSRSLIPTTIGFFKSHRSSGIHTVVGSCNGLVCIEKRAWDDAINPKVKFCIWNPCTNEFKESSVEPIIQSDYTNNIYGFGVYTNNIYGFGYDQTIDDYKVLSNTISWIDNQYVTVVQVYTLRTNSWKRIKNYHPFQLYSMTKFVRNGASFYCSARKSPLGSFLDVIFCFDIAKEEYREISKPWFVDNTSPVWLTVLNECLCIVQNASPKSRAVEVWMLKDYCHGNMNKNEYSWTKLYTIREPGIRYPHWFNPLEIFNKNGGDQILIQLPPRKQNLVWYNEKDDSMRETRSLKLCGRDLVIEAYIENLVSLNSGTYMGLQKEEEQQAERVEDNQFYKQRRRRRRNRNRNRNGKHNLIH